MIWITGDKHGDFKSIYWFCEDNECMMSKEDYIIILGDFGGIWNYKGVTKEEEEELDKLENLPCSILFIDGNHENHKRLNAYPVEEWHGGNVHKIRPHVIHLMRGQVFEIGGKKFATIGGAPSHDIQHGVLDPAKYEDDAALKQAEIDLCNKHGGYQYTLYRIKDRDWWAEEVPSELEWRQAFANFEVAGHIDFILSHEAPANVVRRVSIFKPTDMSLRLTKLAEFIDYNFGIWYFGHYHIDGDFGEYRCAYRSIRRIA